MEAGDVEESGEVGGPGEEWVGLKFQRPIS